jgi:hypothetical protein
LPLTLTLRSAITEVNYPVEITDASGYFTVSVAGLPDGLYNWRVKSAQVGTSPPKYNPGWLAVGGTLSLGGSSISEQEMGIQPAGDCDNNNRVDVIDFITVKNSFGRSVGEFAYDNRADIDGNLAITAIDFVLLKGNFGLGGAPPVGPRRP